MSVLLHDSGVSFKQFDQFNAAHSITYYNIVIPIEGLHEWVVKVSWLFPSTRGKKHNLSTFLLVEKVDEFSVGMIEQKILLSREMLVDAIKIQINAPSSEHSHWRRSVKVCQTWCICSAIHVPQFF